jgi:hypothetical protein
MQRRMQRRLKMRGGEITQQILDALNDAGATANNLAKELEKIAADLPPSSSASGGTKKRKLKIRRRKTMKR